MEIIKKIYTFVVSRLGKIQSMVLLGLLIFVLFFSEYNFFTSRELNSEIDELDKQIEYYKKQVEEDQRKLDELDADKEQVEKFARENYLMKKADEDIFLVEE